MTDDRLVRLLSVVPPQSLVLLEDVDSVLPKQDGESSRATFSGLLNALDGVVATEERIIFMTTNHVHRLPPVLIRPGRIDLRCWVGLASEPQLRAMFSRFFPGSERLEDFVVGLRDVPLSMADVQGFFMFFKEDEAGLFENLEAFAEGAKAAVQRPPEESPEPG